jgi:hypothetical protein
LSVGPWIAAGWWVVLRSLGLAAADDHYDDYDGNDGENEKEHDDRQQ